MPNFDDPLDLGWLRDLLKEVAKEFDRPREDRAQVATKAMGLMEDHLRDHALVGLLADRVDNIFAGYTSRAVFGLHELARERRSAASPRSSYSSGAPTAADNHARSRYAAHRSSVEAILNNEIAVPSDEPSLRWGRERLADLTAEMLESVAQHRETLGVALKNQAQRLRQIAQELRSLNLPTVADLPANRVRELHAIVNNKVTDLATEAEVA